MIALFILCKQRQRQWLNMSNFVQESCAMLLKPAQYSFSVISVVFQIIVEVKGGALQIFPATTCCPDCCPHIPDKLDVSVSCLKWKESSGPPASNKLIHNRDSILILGFNTCCNLPGKVAVWLGYHITTIPITILHNTEGVTLTAGQHSDSFVISAWLSITEKIGKGSELRGSVKCSVKQRHPHLWQTFLHPW